MKKIFITSSLFVSIIALFGLLFTPIISTAHAAPPVAVNTKDQAQDGVKKAGGTGSGNTANDFTAVIKSVIGIISFLIGLIAVLMIVIAGFRFVTSNGDANTVSSARNTILYAIIGIVIAVMAYAIVNFVLDNLT
ncbi:MAG: hypothetical protein Q7T74_07545 [Candidatus Saccharibacteria bacterium]|nr:hypothetical protein [Candidatus Saccharibacteria bacterium]